MTALAELAQTVQLVDHHCHGVLGTDPDRTSFELLATESDWPAPGSTSVFDTQFGVAMRAECAPLLDLPRHVDAGTYLARRHELGHEEVTRRLLRATGIGTYLVETGYRSADVLGPERLAEVAGARAHEVVRLERLAEDAAAGRPSVDAFLADLETSIDRAAESAAGFKSIIAYRYGLDFDPDRPTDAEVRTAAADWLAGLDGAAPRLNDPVLLRHLLWSAVDRGRPLQMHVGYGDSDIVLHRCDPSKMTEFLRRTRTSGATIMLLHCYPYHRQAAILAQVYPHVYLDTGAAVNYTGLGSEWVVAEALEMAPFTKMLFSTDAFGLPELYLCGAVLWRRAVAGIFGRWVAEDRMGESDAARYLGLIAHGNSTLAYGREW